VGEIGWWWWWWLGWHDLHRVTRTGAQRMNEKPKKKRKEKKREMFSYVYGHTQTIYTIYIHVTYLNRYIPAAVAAAEAAAVENDVTP
jgi:hypothetical protein